MKTHIVKIGNSQGIRIPKILLEESQLGNEVELIVEREQIIIRSAQKARSGWDKAFQKMAKHGDDQLLDAPFIDAHSSWDEEEWEWE